MLYIVLLYLTLLKTNRIKYYINNFIKLTNFLIWIKILYKNIKIFRKFLLFK